MIINATRRNSGLNVTYIDFRQLVMFQKHKNVTAKNRNSRYRSESNKILYTYLLHLKTILPQFSSNSETLYFSCSTCIFSEKFSKSEKLTYISLNRLLSILIE